MRVGFLQEFKRSGSGCIYDASQQANQQASSRETDWRHKCRHYISPEKASCHSAKILRAPAEKGRITRESDAF